MLRILKRIAISSSVFAVVGVFVCGGPVRLAAQGARARGAAPTAGQAVPSGGGQAVPRGGERATRSEARAPQAESRRAEPSRGEGAATRALPPRRAEFPTATAVPRTLPQGPQRRPDYRPDYRSGNQGSNYRREYQPNYRQLYRPDYRQSYRPYYTFRPRVRLGFGLWIGYPVTYPTYFYPSTPYPYAYSSPYPSAYAYPTAIYPAPGTTASVGAAGGLSFDITPAEAGVYVDGYYMGLVAQFTPDQPPLALAPGRHHVEIREPGFEVIAFDVDILPGQVIPYQGDLRRF